MRLSSTTVGPDTIATSRDLTQIDVFESERLGYAPSADAIGLGHDAALPPVTELKGKVAEFGRGERSSADTLRVKVRITPERVLPAGRQSA
jgi:hypothetical protein